MVAILLVGLVRFGLTVSGAPDEVTKYASMTVVILAGCVYFGAACLSWKELLPVSYLLILPYMAVELGGIGYTWATGKTTIFHVPQYSFGLEVNLHFWGHLGHRQDNDLPRAPVLVRTRSQPSLLGTSGGRGSRCRSS